jgi:heavy metal translocating P-type ATPase
MGGKGIGGPGSFSMRAVLAITLAGLVAGGALYLAGLHEAGDIAWALATSAALIPLAIATARTLLRGRIGVDIIAILAMAVALALGQYLAGAVIALMLSGGQFLETLASKRARRELSALLARSPRDAHRYRGQALETIPVEQVAPGDRLLVKPGEIVPVDGIVVGGTAVLDESALTGESRPVERQPGEPVRSGAVNSASSPFELRASAAAAQSTYAGIVRLVEQAQASKAPLVRLADRYALLFLPATLAVAAGAWAASGDPVRALAVLVVATPCPLILAAPVAIISGVSRAARRGVVVKGGGALEALAEGKTLVLDKTGTVTAGTPAVSSVESFGARDPDEILRLAASLDQVSPHVLAAPILRAAAERGLDLSFPSEVHEELGSGIRGLVDGRRVALGKRDWLAGGAAVPRAVERLSRRILLDGASGVFVAIDGELAGVIILEDPIRPDAPLTVRALRRSGFNRIVMLTGDHAEVAEAVGSILGVDAVLAERSPEGKVEAVRDEARRAPTVMVGDGINDAPALALASVGVAMGARGATASSEAADIVLVSDRIDRLVEARRIARRSRRIALESIWAGMGLSFAGMGLAAAGLLIPVAGAVAQELIDVLVILNALRALGEPRAAPERARQAAFGPAFRAEHARLMPQIKRIRDIADRLELLPPETAREELERAHRFLAQHLLPHEQAEDATVYPAVARIIGGEDPTAAMSRMHLEIAHRIKVLGGYLADRPPGGPSPEDLREFRRLLYGLDAILRLHFAQEEESYLALLEQQRPAEAEDQASGRLRVG